MNGFDGMSFVAVMLAGKELDKDKRNQMALLASMTSNGNMMGIVPYIFAVRAEKKLQDCQNELDDTITKLGAMTQAGGAAKANPPQAENAGGNLPAIVKSQQKAKGGAKAAKSNQGNVVNQ